MADNATMQEALENIARMVILHIPTAPYGSMVHLEFVIAMRDVARQAIDWKPDYLQQQLERK
jgi:hypothetical protein